MDRLMASLFFAGMIHETTSSIPKVIPPDVVEMKADAFVEKSQRFRHYFLVQGVLAKKVCRQNGKLFGAFARAQSFRPAQPFDPLTTKGFKSAFEQTLIPLGPDIDIIATIGPWFVDSTRVDPIYRAVMRGSTGELQDIFQEMMAPFRKNYHLKGAPKGRSTESVILNPFKLPLFLPNNIR